MAGSVGTVLRAYIRVYDGGRYVKRAVPAGGTGIRPLIAGNHKTNLTVDEATMYMGALLQRVDSLASRVPDVDIVVAPSPVSLASLHYQLSARRSSINLAAQAIHWEAKGAFTGDHSAEQMKAAGADFALVGHSERRLYHNETDGQINQMIVAAFRAGLRPILCVGEGEADRNAGRTAGVILTQVLADLGIRPTEGGSTRITTEQMPLVTVAYEPVWAIGKGNAPATPEQAEDVHALIRRTIENEYGEEIALKLRILYGGNVSPDNIAGFMAMNNVDGALVGGASLDADKFAGIIKFGLPA